MASVSHFPQALIESFASMKLRSGLVKGHYADDESLWDIPNYFGEARDLSEFPPRFRVIYSEFARLCGDSAYVSWSASASLAYVTALCNSAPFWVPTLLEECHRPYCAGVIALQASCLCAAAARRALLYPNTRSYPLEGDERTRQAQILQGVIQQHNTLIGNVQSALRARAEQATPVEQGQCFSQ